MAQAKDSKLTVLVNSEVKAKANEICNNVGLNLTTAVNAFLLAVCREGGIPFALNQEPLAQKLDLISPVERSNMPVHRANLKDCCKQFQSDAGDLNRAALGQDAIARSDIKER